ncbi:MAG: oligosaccharide flippase family protein [Robiginitomaculum sp.]
MGDIRDIIRGALSSLFGFGGRLFARAILMIFAGHWYGMSVVGGLGQVAAITEIAATFGVLGLKRSLLDMLSYRAERGQSIEQRLVEAIILSVGLGLILSVIMIFAWPFIEPQTARILPLLFLGIPAIVLTEVALSAIKFKRVIKWDVLSRGITEPWSFLILAVIFYKIGLTQTGLVMAYCGSLIISALTVGIGLCSVYGVRSLLSARPKLANILKIPKQSLPVGLTDLGVMMLRRVDILVLGVFVPQNVTGIYYILQQLATIPQRVNNLFEPMVSPVIARLHNQYKKEGIRANLVSICRWIFIIQLALSIPMVLFGDFILSWFGPGFSAGIVSLAIILLAELIDGSFITTETALLYAQPKLPQWILFIGLVVEVIMIALCSHLWGLEGAAIGFLLGIITITLGRLLMLKRKMGIMVLTPDYFSTVIIGAVMTAVLIVARVLAQGHHGLWMVFAIFIALTLYVYLTRAFSLTKTDKIIWRAFTHKKSKRSHRRESR